MTTIHVEIPNSQTSKQEEIDTLTKLVTNLSGTGSYLESLLNAQVLKWFTANVRDDFAPDLFDNLVKSEAELHQAKGDLAKETGAREQVAKELTEARNLANEEHTRYLEAIKERNEWRDRDIENDNKWREANDQLIEDLDAAHGQVSALEDRIAHLKARIYDLEHPEG